MTDENRSETILNPKEEAKSTKLSYIAKASLILLAVIGYWGVQHFDLIKLGVLKVYSVISPFILGCVIAFVFIVPLRFIEKHLAPKCRKFDKYRRGTAYVLTLLFFILVVGAALLVVIPEISEAIKQIIKKIPIAFTRLQNYLEELAVAHPEIQDFINEESDMTDSEVQQEIAEILMTYGGSAVGGGIGIVTGILGGITNVVIAFIFSIYLVLQKEKIGSQVKQIVYSKFSEEKADRFVYVVRLANRIFSNFLSGQCIEAVILGAMFFVTLSIFRIPYALLIGVVIAVTALIPVFGAFIGCVIGAFLIVIENPMQALYFVIIFLVLQQIENNLIYPRVVGGSIGLPALWVLFAVTVGGSLFGVSGILIFIPICSLAYALYREHVKNRLKEKNVPYEKYRELTPAESEDLIDLVEKEVYGRVSTVDMIEDPETNKVPSTRGPIFKSHKSNAESRTKTNTNNSQRNNKKKKTNVKK